MGLQAWGCRLHRALLLEDEALGRVDVDADQPLQQLSHGGPAEALHRALALCGARREAWLRGVGVAWAWRRGVAAACAPCSSRPQWHSFTAYFERPPRVTLMECSGAGWGDALTLAPRTTGGG